MPYFSRMQASSINAGRLTGSYQYFEVQPIDCMPVKRRISLCNYGRWCCQPVWQWIASVYWSPISVWRFLWRSLTVWDFWNYLICYCCLRDLNAADFFQWKALFFHKGEGLLFSPLCIDQMKTLNFPPFPVGIPSCVCVWYCGGAFDIIQEG